MKLKNVVLIRDVNSPGDFRLGRKRSEAKRIRFASPPEAEDLFASLRFRFDKWKFAEGEYFPRVFAEIQVEYLVEKDEKRVEKG